MLNICPSDDFEEERVVSETVNHLNSYALRGLRTLCMARRVSSPNKHNNHAPRGRLNLTFAWLCIVVKQRSKTYYNMEAYVSHARKQQANTILGTFWKLICFFPAKKCTVVLQQISVIRPQNGVTGNIVAGGWLHSAGIVWELWAHIQLIRECLFTVVSACWATVDWSLA